MRSSALDRAIRCCVSASIALASIKGATYLRQVNHTTVALALVLLTLGLAIRWGWMEALSASLAGGLGFDHFFLSSQGFGVESSERVVTLLAFLLTAITTGGLAARVSRHRSASEERAAELGHLYDFSSALRDSGHMDTVLDRIADHVVETLGAEGAAFFDLLGGRIFRSGAGAGRIADDKVREVASTGVSEVDRDSAVSIVAVRESGNLVGSLGLAGLPVSQRMLDVIAERVGVTIEKAHAARQSMEAELIRRSENLKSAVLDALAHEIKGPLATVKISVSTLLSQQPGNAEQQQELLKIINEETDRMKQWIEDAVRMSSRDASDLHLRKTPSQIRPVVERAMDGLGRLDGRPIELAIDDSLPLAVFDEAMIEKVIRQLLDNAIKYSPPGSPIRISAEFTGAEIIIGVSDCGLGIPKNDQERIFEKHYRGQNGSGHVPGTGLGLSSAKCILEAHGGEIWVQSNPGVGSFFRISLPVIMEASSEHSEDLERR